VEEFMTLATKNDEIAWTLVAPSFIGAMVYV
jgi:hypothetical protein